MSEGTENFEYLFENDRVAYYWWITYYCIKYVIIMPIEISWVWKFYKMRDTEIVRKRNFTGWMWVLCVTIFYGNHIDPMHFIKENECVELS